MSTKQIQLNELQQISGVGKTVANDLWNLGFKSIADLKGQNPEAIYILHNDFRGKVQDICMLYTFRCAVYFANTDARKRNPAKLKWWNWMDKEKVTSKAKDGQIRKSLKIK
jgi:hypothetical protein